VRETIEHVFSQRGAPVVALAERGPQELRWQGSLLAAETPWSDRSFAGLVHIELDDCCWIDHCPRWLRGSDEVVAHLLTCAGWRQRTVKMYDRIVAEPRLVWSWAPFEEAAPLEVLEDVRRQLGDRYGRTFDSAACNLYRDGRDSVAWHADRVRHTQAESVIAIVSVGAPRPFLVRPVGGGPSRSFLPGMGDLLVMGGACQHHFEHTVPKVARPCDPRISIQYRHD